MSRVETADQIRVAAATTSVRAVRSSALVREATTAESSTNETPGALPEVLTVDELAGLLRVERKTAYAAIGRGEIPGVRRIGTVLRVSRDAVLTWLAQGQGRVSRSRKLQ